MAFTKLYSLLGTCQKAGRSLFDYRLLLVRARLVSTLAPLPGNSGRTAPGEEPEKLETTASRSQRPSCKRPEEPVGSWLTLVSPKVHWARAPSEYG